MVVSFFCTFSPLFLRYYVIMKGNQVSLQKFFRFHPTFFVALVS